MPASPTTNQALPRPKSLQGLAFVQSGRQDNLLIRQCSCPARRRRDYLVNGPISHVSPTDSDEHCGAPSLEDGEVQPHRDSVMVEVGGITICTS